MATVSKRGRIPGIAVLQRPPEQTARILGTGIEVWEVLRAYLALDRDWGRLRRAFDWLTEDQLRAALEYANEHEQAMLARIELEDQDIPESLRPS